MIVLDFCELDKEAFALFLKDQPLNDFVQSPKMEEISLLNGYPSCYVGVKKNNQIVAGSRIVLEKRKFGICCYAPRGLILDYEDKELLTFFIKELKKYLKKKKGYVLIIDPKITYKERDINGDLVEGGYDHSEVVQTLKSLGFKHDGFHRGIDNSKQVRWVFTLPLQGKDETTIWNEMKPITRNLIRKAEKIGVQIKELSYDELDQYKAITEDTSKRRNFKDRPMAYYQTMYQAFHDSGEVKFLLAQLPLKEYLHNLEKELQEEEDKLNQTTKKYSQNYIQTHQELIDSCKKRIVEAKQLQQEKGDYLPLAAAMFMTYGNEVIYLFSGNIDIYMKFNAQYLMQWHMIKYAIQKGFPLYNFYGISGIFDKQDPEYGVYEFKRKFNGHVEEYIGSFSLPLSPLYKVKLKLKRK